MSRLKLMSVYCALWARQHRSTWGRGSSTCPHVTAPEAPGSALASGHALSPGHHSAPTSAPGPTWLACSGLPNTHAPSRAHRRARPTASPIPATPSPPPGRRPHVRRGGGRLQKRGHRGGVQAGMHRAAAGVPGLHEAHPVQARGPLHGAVFRLLGMHRQMRRPAHLLCPEVSRRAGR